ncbi:MAG: FapA family protein [Spirochaetales bacterium]|nr:FapA family protein [Spirochaetales bacterium]
MVSLEQLKEFMRERAEEDRRLRSVAVSGATLEEALKAASVELGVPTRRLEYDVLQKGSQGTLGLGRKPWSLMVFEVKKDAKVSHESDSEFMPEISSTEPVVNEDGHIHIRLWHDGAYIKVTAPVGEGAPANENQALELLHLRNVRDINRQVLKGALKLANGMYGKVGDYPHSPAADTLMTVDIDDQEMRASVVLTPPGMNGADISREELEHFLKNNGVVHGLMMADIEALIDEPVYSRKVVVAQGTKPIPGQDARIIYNFDTTLRIKPKEIEGRVDFKELNTIRNVLKNEELARKEPAQRGIPGRTVTGRSLPTKDGRDIPFDLGNNVTLSKDGLRVLATSDGQVMLLQNKITVETVMVISGNVNNSVGNINFLGSVLVKGSVDDGFTVKAVGNIEVLGNVGKAVLETHADIIVHQGINGGGEGHVIAGQSLWSKFIQNAKVEAGTFVIVSDGILHSQVTAGKKILCKGKRAKIVGGYLRASEEINASSLGAIGSDETILEVGFDPKLKEELDQMVEQKEQLEKNFNQLSLNLQALLKQERIVKTLPPEKLQQKKTLMAKHTEIKNQLSQLTDQLEKRQAELEALRFSGKISSSGDIYPGTRFIIKEVTYDVIRECSGLTFIRDGNVVRSIKYEDIEEDEIARRPG